MSKSIMEGISPTVSLSRYFRAADSPIAPRLLGDSVFMNL
jgi:hypothetical protein